MTRKRRDPPKMEWRQRVAQCLREKVVERTAMYAALENMMAQMWDDLGDAPEQPNPLNDAFMSFASRRYMAGRLVSPQGDTHTLITSHDLWTDLCAFDATERTEDNMLALLQWLEERVYDFSIEDTFRHTGKSTNDTPVSMANKAHNTLLTNALFKMGAKAIMSTPLA